MTKTARVAIVFVACVIFFACEDNFQENLEEHKKELKKVAHDVNSDFVVIREEVKKIADFTRSLYINQDKYVKKEDRSKYRFSDNGIYYKYENDGLSAVYISGASPITEKVKDIVYFTAPLDTMFISIINALSEVAQVYYNDKHSYNRIYPFIDVLTQYGPKLEIPTFNFYYLADSVNNPERNAVWVNEPYVDPAGRGWMVSAIAPVYYNGEMVGVPGIDVTINTIINRYLSNSHSELVIVDNTGVLVAAEETSVNRLYLPPLKDHKYVETIKSDKFRKDDYNLLKSKNNKVRELADKIILQNLTNIDFTVENEKYLVITENIEEVDWKIFKMLKK